MTLLDIHLPMVPQEFLSRISPNLFFACQSGSINERQKQKKKEKKIGMWGNMFPMGGNNRQRTLSGRCERRGHGLRLVIVRKMMQYAFYQCRMQQKVKLLEVDQSIYIFFFLARYAKKNHLPIRCGCSFRWLRQLWQNFVINRYRKCNSPFVIIFYISSFTLYQMLLMVESINVDKSIYGRNIIIWAACLLQ